jgi:hypothetical protein
MVNLRVIVISLGSSAFTSEDTEWPHPFPARPRASAIFVGRGFERCG